MRRVMSEITVLVVEDRMHMRKIIRSILNGMGIKLVQESHDGRDALGKLKHHSGDYRRYDLVICDWMMPSMSGVELLEVMRKDPSMRELPFLMLTAESDEDNVTRAINAGVSDYILKPFTAKTLENKVLAILESQR